MTEPSFEQSQATMRPHEDAVSLPKILLISALAFATLIPTFFVSGLIAERLHVDIDALRLGAKRPRQALGEIGGTRFVGTVEEI